MGSAQIAQSDSSKTSLVPSSQRLVLRTLELAWVSQLDLCYLTNTSYGHILNITWAVLLRGLLNNPGPDHQDKWASMWRWLCYCWLYHWFIQLYPNPTTKPQQSLGTLGSQLGLLGSACELLSLWSLAVGPKWSFSCHNVCSPVSSPCSLSLEWPFSEASLIFDCLVCRTLVILVTDDLPSHWLRLINGFKSY